MKLFVAPFLALVLVFVMSVVAKATASQEPPLPRKSDSKGAVKDPAANSSTTQSMLNKLLEDIDVEESRMKRGYGGGGGGGHGHGPGRGGGAAGPIYFCGYVGSKEGYGGYGK